MTAPVPSSQDLAPVISLLGLLFLRRPDGFLTKPSFTRPLCLAHLMMGLLVKISTPQQPGTYPYLILLFFVFCFFLNRVGVDLDENLKEEPSSQQASWLSQWIKHRLVCRLSTLLEHSQGSYF